MNQIQLPCTIEHAFGGADYSNVVILPAEMQALDGKSVKVDGETIRFRMWQGKRLYVNCRSWTLGYFSLTEWDLSWGSPEVAALQGNRPSPMVAQAVAKLLGFKLGERLLTA